MSKCEQCIVRQFSSLKALNKEELLRMAECKTSYTIKKGEPIFEEGEVTNEIVTEDYKITDKPIYDTRLFKNKTNEYRKQRNNQNSFKIHRYHC